MGRDKFPATGCAATLLPNNLKFDLYGYFTYICTKYSTVMSVTAQKGKKARFDARLPLDKKDTIEKAARLAGYKHLSDFVLSTVYERAQAIIQDSEAILVSQRDNELFFDALLHPREPNEALKSAAGDYLKIVAEK